MSRKTLLLFLLLAWTDAFAQANLLAVEVANDLAQLANLYEKGLLTAEEFSTAKARILTLPKPVESNNKIIVEDSQSDDKAQPTYSTADNVEARNITATSDLAVNEDGETSKNEHVQSHDTEYAQKSILLIQGNMLGVPSSTVGRAVGAIAGSAVNIASGGLAGVAADIAVKGIASEMLIDREIDQLPVPAVVTNEVVRQLQCDFEEYDERNEGSFDYMSVANRPLPDVAFSKLEELKFEEAKEMWANFFELNQEWQLNEYDQVFWVIYEILADEQSVGDDLQQLKIEMSTFSLGIYDPSRDFENAKGGSFLWLSTDPMVRNYSPARFRDFVNSWATKNIFSDKKNLDSSCSARSMILNNVEQSLNGESDLKQIEEFLERLGVSYKRDRVRRSYSAVYEPESLSDRVDSAVSIEIFYDRGNPRTFSRATVKIID